jgi:hypothetical protein
MPIAPNHRMKKALCASSSSDCAPKNASAMPEPSTPTEVRMTTGPSSRSSSTGGPLRTYGSAWV